MRDSPFGISHNRSSCYATWYIRRRVFALAGRYGFDGDDVAQDLALHLLCQWPLYDSAKGRPTTFIQHVVDTKVCELIRHRLSPKRDLRRLRSLSAIGEAAEHGRLDGVRGPPEVSDQDRATMRIDCETILRQLPADLQQTAALLREMSPAAVARELGISEGALWKRLARLRTHFARAGYGAA